MWRLLPVVLLASRASAAAPPARGCVLESKRVDAVVVEVPAQKGGTLLRVRVQGVPATVRIPVEPGPARVEVRGPIVFAGVTAMDKLPLKARKDTDSTHGMFKLAAGSEGLRVHSRGSRWVEGDAVIGKVELRNITFACEALTVDEIKPAEDNSSEPPSNGWVSKKTTLVLRSAPGSGATMELALREAEDLELVGIEQQKTFRRVRGRLADGSSVTGWVDADALSKRSAGPRPLEDLPLTVGGGCARAVSSTPPQRVDKAVVAAGTRLLVDRLFEWGTLTSKDPVLLRWTPGERWAEVVSLPGYVGADDCPEHSTVLDEAWIPVSAAKLPAAATALTPEVPDAGPP